MGWHTCMCITMNPINGVSVVERCYDDWGWEIVVKDWWWLRQVLELFDHQHYVVAYLASVLIGDLGMLRGTHARKNRLIARLRKFLRVVEMLGFDKYFIDEADEIESIIKVMECVKDGFHCIRNPVHELLYPRIRDMLNEFMGVTVTYVLHEGWGRRVYLRVRYEYNPYRKEYIKHAWIDVKTGKHYSSVRLDERGVKEIIRKKEERQKRRDRDRYLDMNPEDMIMWYVPKILWGGQ